MQGEGRSLTESCTVRKGILKEDRGIGALAVDIDAIVREDAMTAYDDPADFFRMTYATQALKTTATHVFDRITGRNPHAFGIFLLGTALGGGKSHVLACLYHMAQNGSGILPEDFAEELNGLSFPSVRVAVLTQNSPAGDKKPPRTLWGHLAQQLGSYDEIKEFDQNLQCPTKDALLKIISDEPALILMDELTNYLIRAAAVPAGERSLAEQTRVFFQSLEETIDLRTNVALVISQLPEDFEPSDEGKTLDKVAKGTRGAKKEEIRDRALRETRLSARLILRKAETQIPVKDDVELDEDKLVRWLEYFGIKSEDSQLLRAHCSGHASGPDLKDMIRKIKPMTIYPIHAEEKSVDIFRAEFENVTVPELSPPLKEYQV